MGVYRMKIKIIKRWENEEYKGKRESDAVPWPGFFPSFLLHAPAQHTYPSRTHMHDLFIKYDFDTWRSFKSKFYLSACVWIEPFLVPGEGMQRRSALAEKGCVSVTLPPHAKWPNTQLPTWQVLCYKQCRAFSPFSTLSTFPYAVLVEVELPPTMLPWSPLFWIQIQTRVGIEFDNEVDGHGGQRELTTLKKNIKLKIKH